MYITVNINFKKRINKYTNEQQFIIKIFRSISSVKYNLTLISRNLNDPNLLLK